MQSAEPEASPDVDTGPPMHLEAPLEDAFGAPQWLSLKRCMYAILHKVLCASLSDSVHG